MTKRIVAISAGLGQPSTTRLLADRLTEATVSALGTDPAIQDDTDLQVVELRDLAHDVTNAMLTHFLSERLEEVQEQLRSADGVIVVTPIFTASYSGLFKSFMDVLEPDVLSGTPVLIGATGGTARHSLALEFAVRPLLAYLHAAVVPTGVFAATADFGSGATQLPESAVPGLEPQTLPQRIAQAATELADAVRRSAKPATSDPFDLTVEFADLLPG